MSKVFYLDCEYNSFGGQLLSLALVARDGSEEFYRVLDRRGVNIHPWVARHVVPVFNNDPVPLTELQRELREFLPPRFTIVADWPEDISHFCTVLLTGPGKRLPYETFCCIVRSDLNSENSRTPHNALEDARAMKAMDNVP